MHTDARITLYGGVAISALVAAVGQLAGHHTLVITGAALMGAVVALALAFDATLADPADHLDDVDDGCGCVEIWDAASKHRDD